MLSYTKKIKNVMVLCVNCLIVRHVFSDTLIDKPNICLILIVICVHDIFQTAISIIPEYLNGISFSHTLLTMSCFAGKLIFCYIVIPTKAINDIINTIFLADYYLWFYFSHHSHLLQVTKKNNAFNSWRVIAIASDVISDAST